MVVGAADRGVLVGVVEAVAVEFGGDGSVEISAGRPATARGLPLLVSRKSSERMVRPPTEAAPVH